MRSSAVMVCVSLLSAGAFAQSGKGTLAGKVLDPFGYPATLASVQVKDAQSGATFKGAIGKDGGYSIPDLPAGSYDVTVNMPAVQGFSQKGVAVAAAKTTTLDVRLKEGTQLSTLGEDALHSIEDEKRHAAPSGLTPRTVDGKPDFSGVWWRPATVDPGKPEWTAWAQQVARERTENNRLESPKARCLPSNIMFTGAVWQFVQSKDTLVWISDDDFPGFHQIYIGRKHPQDPNPGWYGHSVAKWDGDTLVVDRIAFDERMWLDQASHPHSEQLHMIEKYRRPDLGHLEMEVTTEDPKALAKPFTQKLVSELAANEEIFEFICTENNRDVQHLVGK
ncbi:MAG TPA: carboxypeptidase-like regulatory domain-containing protein [Bryobacteraceae bacterium]|nr:carboxypeptidase-like regulatory domain-containing protein [Bryobacteraceae bacterium]